MTRRIKLTLVALILSLSFGQMACTREGWYLLGAVAEVAVYAAVTAAVLSAHDTHYHTYHCGHRHVMYEGRPVYEYRGHWEYYDSYDGRWYYYPDGISGY